MENLNTSYMGLELKSPLIVASSRITSKTENCQKAEEFGAGAIVLRSLFEEQIIADMIKNFPEEAGKYHPEAIDYYETVSKDQSIFKYFDLIEQTKKAVNIPVIASIHCVSEGEWVNYSSKLEQSGADAIELNLYITPKDNRTSPMETETQYFNIVEAVKSKVKVPVSVKISPYFTNLLHMVERFDAMKVAAVVLFNRYYRFDIDIEKQKLVPGKILSNPDELSVPMRWISLLYGHIKSDIAASTGIHNSEALIKQLLVGANVAQVASILYQKDLSAIAELLEGLKSWMKSHNYEKLSDFRGKLSKVKSQDPVAYERIQFIRQDMELK